MYAGVIASLASKKLNSCDDKLVSFIRLPVEFVIMHHGDNESISEHDKPAGSCEDSSYNVVTASPTKKFLLHWN